MWPGPQANSIAMNIYLCAPSHMSQELWQWNCENPKESVQRPSQDTSKNCVVWSRILKCSVKSYVDHACNQILFQWNSIHADPYTWSNKIKQQLWAFRSAMVSRFCVRPTSKRWFLWIVQVTMKHDPLDANVGIHVDFTSVLHSHTPLVPQA